MNLKLSFIIKNINGKLSYMQEERKNIDSIIEGRIRRSLSSEIGEDFSLNLMKRIELEQQFREEDKKTFNIAKAFTVIMTILFIGFASVLGLYFASSGSAEMVSDNLASRITFYFDMIGYKFVELTGFSGQMGFMILVAMAVIFLFTIAEKRLLRKSN
jgi:hypothetical protein